MHHWSTARLPDCYPSFNICDQDRNTSGLVGLYEVSVCPWSLSSLNWQWDTQGTVASRHLGIQLELEYQGVPKQTSVLLSALSVALGTETSVCCSPVQVFFFFFFLSLLSLKCNSNERNTIALDIGKTPETHNMGSINHYQQDPIWFLKQNKTKQKLSTEQHWRGKDREPNPRKVAGIHRSPWDISPMLIVWAQVQFGGPWEINAEYEVRNHSFNPPQVK